MNGTTIVARWVLRIAGIVQIVLGLIFWTGRAMGYLPFHLMNGFLIVLALWTLAILALVAGARRGLAALALLWGLVTPALGITQTTLMIGNLHWIVRVVHLLVGLIALGVGDTLAGAILARRRGEAMRAG